jgi:tetratricopeptide (TPR) repeat protein
VRVQVVRQRRQGRGVALAQSGRARQAVGDVTLALQLTPNDRSLWLQRGRAYLTCRAWDLAAGDFDEALKRDDRCAEAYQGRALARLWLSRPHEAAEDAEAVARCANGDPLRLHAAAALLVQASGQMDGDRRGPASAQRATAHLHDRAVALLKSALECVPPERRPDFWVRHVHDDRTLRPLWSHDGFRHLQRRHGRAAGSASRRGSS